jgi:hypothetical protein
MGCRVAHNPFAQPLQYLGSIHLRGLPPCAWLYYPVKT